MKTIRYLVIQKGNGRFYPRIENNLVVGWPYPLPKDGYATLEEVKSELIKVKEEREKKEKLNKETEVFELK